MRLSPRLLALALPLVLAGCGGGEGDNHPPPVTTGSTSRFNVQPCLDQVVSPGMTVANLVVPDTIKDDLSKPSGFPNGRRLTDPVIDLTLAFLFIDIGKHGADALAKIPVNPAGNDLQFRAAFPYLAAPQGNPPGLTPGGTTFSFRTDPVSSYVQVDRMGMPAVATAVIGSSAKTGYNDDSPGVDGTRKYVPEIQNTLTALTNALADDFGRLGLTVCAKGA